MKQELIHVKKAFIETNGYPSNLVTSVLQKIHRSNREDTTNTTDDINATSEEGNEEEENRTTLSMKVPYAGKEGENIVKNLQNTLTRNLPTNLTCRVVQTGTKLATRFNIKDQVDGKHLSNFIYHHKCANKKCKDSYIGETARRRTLRTEEHGGKDKKSWIFKHSSRQKSILVPRTPTSKSSHPTTITNENEDWQKQCTYAT